MSKFFTYEERLELQKYLKESLSFKEISRRLGKNPTTVNVNMKMQKSSSMKMHKYFIVLCSKNIKYFTVGNLSLVP